MADRLERRGWKNYGLCKLCNQVQETAAHLLYKCRFTTRVWAGVKDWLGLNNVCPNAWQSITTVNDWWTEVINKKSPSRKAIMSLAMLISWEIWNERNARVFRNHAKTNNMIVEKIKNEVTMWGLAGAKALSNVILRE